MAIWSVLALSEDECQYPTRCHLVFPDLLLFVKEIKARRLGFLWNPSLLNINQFHDFWKQYVGQITSDGLMGLAGVCLEPQFYPITAPEVVRAGRGLRAHQHWPAVEGELRPEPGLPTPMHLSISAHYRCLTCSVTNVLELSVNAKPNHTQRVNRKNSTNNCWLGTSDLFFTCILITEQS